MSRLTGFLMAISVAMLVALAAWSAGGCSALPVVTPTNVTHVSCTWNLADGAVAEDNDCLIDRASSEGATDTVGNETGPIEVSPQTDVSLTP